MAKKAVELEAVGKTKADTGLLVRICVAAWLIPGCGHLMLGRRGRAFILFGAIIAMFLLGIAMPRGLFAREIQRQPEPFAVVFLLPMFFTFSGLNTRLDIVNSPQLLGIAAVVILAACLGKGGACWAAARWHGEDNRTALAIGTLMNARGLMELIIINIGLQRGVIEPRLTA